MGATKIPSNLQQAFPSNRLRNGKNGQTIKEEEREGGPKESKIES